MFWSASKTRTSAGTVGWGVINHFLCKSWSFWKCSSGETCLSDREWAVHSLTLSRATSSFQFSDRQQDQLQDQPMSFSHEFEPFAQNWKLRNFDLSAFMKVLDEAISVAPWPSGQPDQRMISWHVVVSSSVAHTTKTACYVIGDFIEPIGEGSDRLPCYTISLPVPVGHPRSSFQKTDSEGSVCGIWYFLLWQM